MENRDFPKDPQKNLVWRHKMLVRAKEDPKFQAMIKKLFHEDILFAFNGFFYTLDPRKRPYQHQPFCTYPYQDEALIQLTESIETGRDEVWEKSRDMGASWMILLTYLWFWLDPRGGGDFLMGSRIEDYVDKKGDPRTLFQKLRYALYRLPAWLRPKGFSPRKHDTYMRLLNPQTGATIIGESNNPNFSTGGRFLSVLFDEFAKWEGSDVAAWTAAGDATPSRVANSTPFGAGGQYYTLVTDGKTKKTTLHWSLHPEKALGLACIWPPPNEGEKDRLGDWWKPEEKLTSAWYEKECLRRTPTEIAQELDIDYLGAGNPVFDGAAWTSLNMFRKMKEETEAWGLINTKDMTVIEQQEPHDPEGLLQVFRKFHPGCQYALGVDIAEGKEEGDYSVIIVLNRTTMNVDANYFSRIDEVTLARVIKSITDYYSPSPGHHLSPWVGIETIGPGLATFDFAAEYGVTNLFMMPKYDTVKGSVSYLKGFRTNVGSRNELVAGIQNYLMDRVGNPTSQRLIAELSTFVHNKVGKPIAKEGCHDDEVMAFGIALQVHETAPLSVEITKPRLLGTYDVTQPPMEELKTDEDNSIENLCFQTVLTKKSLNGHEDLFWEGF